MGSASKTQEEHEISPVVMRRGHSQYLFDKEKPVISYNSDKNIIKKFIDENFQDCDLIDFDREHLKANRGLKCKDNCYL